MIDAAKLEEWSALEAEATPGPYHSAAESPSSGFERVFTGTADGPGQTVAQWMLPRDARFYAAAREAVPALIAEVSALQHAVRSLRGAWTRADRDRINYARTRDKLKDEVERLRNLMLNDDTGTRLVNVQCDLEETHANARLAHTGVRLYEAWPANQPLKYNGSGEPCDMWTGPCSCGASHVEGK